MDKYGPDLKWFWVETAVFALLCVGIGFVLGVLATHMIRG